MEAEGEYIISIRDLPFDVLMRIAVFDTKTWRAMIIVLGMATLDPSVQAMAKKHLHRVIRKKGALLYVLGRKYHNPTNDPAATYDSFIFGKNKMCTLGLRTADLLHEICAELINRVSPHDSSRKVESNGRIRFQLHGEIPWRETYQFDRAIMEKLYDSAINYSKFFDEFDKIAAENEWSHVSTKLWYFMGRCQRKNGPEIIRTLSTADKYGDKTSLTSAKAKNVTVIVSIKKRKEGLVVVEVGISWMGGVSESARFG